MPTNKCIFVVDDDPSVRISMERLLREHGYEVKLFESAAALLGMSLGAMGRGAVITLANSDTVARMPQRTLASAAGVLSSVHALGAIVVNPLVGVAVKRSGYMGVGLALAAWTVPLAFAWISWPAPPVRPDD